MNRLIFINRFYWPDEPATSQLLTDLAERLAASGHCVRVVTSRPPEALRRETRRAVEIVRVAGVHQNRHHRMARLLNLASFTLGAIWHVLWQVRRGDVCIVLTDPPMLGAWCWPWLTLRKVALVHWIQDIYPEIAMELTSHRWLRVLRPYRNLVWRRSRACVTLGPDMARVVSRAGVSPDRLQVIPNWAPVGLSPAASRQEVEDLRHAWGLDGKFVLLYSGNLGRVHDLTPLLRVADRLHAESRFVLLFVGQGAQLAALRHEATARDLANVRFLPPQPRNRLSTVLSVGDVHFVTLRPGCEDYVLPSKLYGIAAVGRPAIVIGPTSSAFAHEVVNAGFGRAFTRDDIEGLCQFLLELSRDEQERQQLGRAARVFAQAHSLEQAADRWKSILPSGRTLAAPPPSHQSSA